MGEGGMKLSRFSLGDDIATHTVPHFYETFHTMDR